MRLCARLLLAFAAWGASCAWANFHLFQMNEVYSNADGSIQFLELTALSGGQQFLSGHTLTTNNGGSPNSYAFTTNLPGDTAGKKFLVATQGFAALGLLTPDYVVPNGFFFPGGGTIVFGEGSDTWTHPALSGGASSFSRSGSTGPATVTNFVGVTIDIGEITVSPSTTTFSGTSVNTSSPPNVVTLINFHTGPVTISAIASTNPEFAVLSGCGSEIAPGASCQAGIYFTPGTDGVRVGTLTVTSNAPNSPHTGGLEGTGERTLVTHYYRSILRRAPDAGGKAFWTNESTRVSGLGANVNEVWFAMAQSFYSSAEYAAFNRDNEGYVTDLYFTFFNRATDPAGLDFWKGQLDAGLPREVALAAFMFSTEFASFTSAIFGSIAVRAEIDAVTDFYRGLLSRLPDDGGFGFWIGRFRAAQCQGPAQVLAEVEAISQAFVDSAEYAGRARTDAQYVGDLYNAFLRRGGDLAGVQFWIDQVGSGARTRDNVRQAFRDSPEFQARVQRILQESCNS